MYCTQYPLCTAAQSNVYNRQLLMEVTEQPHKGISSVTYTSLTSIQDTTHWMLIMATHLNNMIAYLALVIRIQCTVDAHNNVSI